MITFLTHHRKKIACLLLSSFFMQTTFPVIAYAKAMAGPSPVSEQLDSLVDPFTGDFGYSVPLLYVPGPNGENFPVVMNYNAGIRMDQEASWVGLGWDLNPGEISRQVKGVADDWNGVVQELKQQKRKSDNSATESSNRLNRFYGPMYWSSGVYPYEDNLLTTSDDSASMDIYQTNRLLTGFGAEDAFEGPNYDEYVVSGPGISGKMTPRLFQYGRLMQKNNNIGTVGQLYTDVVYNYSTGFEAKNAFTRALEFRMTNECTEVTTNKYRKQAYTAYPSSDMSIPDNTNAANSGSKYNTDLPSGGSALGSRAPQGSVIKYFTNAQIRTGGLAPSGFLDFQKTASYPGGIVRDTSTFPADGIGAFQVISPNGMVYHYSLPVYTKNNETHSFPLLNTARASTVGAYDSIDKYQNYTRNMSAGLYATSWKLTAITGLDYKDANSNGVADQGDTGYWTSFDYGLWQDNFSTTFPFYNYTTLDLMAQVMPFWTWKQSIKYAISDYKYTRQGSYNRSTEQLYYLNAIRTATHSAFFIKDLRMDAHSNIISGVPLKCNPKLKLSKIILVKNDQLGSLTYESLLTSSSTFDNQVMTSYLQAMSSGQNKVIDIKDYTINKSLLDAGSLKTIDLISDYSLCGKLYNNANNLFVRSYKDAPGEVTGGYLKGVYSATASGEENNSGKLTLNSIHFKEYQGVQVFPSYEFDYDQDNPLKNPDYHPDQQDFWGYYKSDFDARYRGHYTSQLSKEHTDAWSLKKITTPIGAEIMVEYESDQYEWLGYDDEYSRGLIRPNRSFLIYDAEKESGTGYDTRGYFLDKDAAPFIRLNGTGDEPSVLKYLAKMPLRNASRADISYTTYSNNLATGYSPIKDDLAGNTILLNISNPTDYDATYYSNYLKERGDGFINLDLSFVYGGGLRVKSISMKDPESQEEYKKQYQYESGIASSEPGWFALPKRVFEPWDFWSYNLLTSSYNSETHIIRPTVGYSMVTVTNKGLDGTENGSVIYQYNNYKEPYLPVVSHSNGISCGTNCTTLPQIAIVADSNAAFYGTLARTIVKDSFGNTLRVVSRSYRAMGLNEEAFYSRYNYSYTNHAEIAPVLRTMQVSKVSIMRNYTAVLKSEVTQYMGTEQSRVENVAFDRLTGLPVKMIMDDRSEGIKEILTTPAYLVSGNDSMGSALNGTGYNNNLLAVGKKEVKAYRLSNMPQNSVAQSEKTLIGGERTKWSNKDLVRKFSGTNIYGHGVYVADTVRNYWKAHKNYSFNGDTSDTDWRLDGEVTLLDAKGNVLETKSNKDNYSAIKYGTENRILASGKNVKYAHFAYSGFEEQIPLGSSRYEYGGEVYGYDGSYRVDSTSGRKAHSGKYMGKIASGETYGPNFVIKSSDMAGLAGKNYVARMWIHKDSPAATKIFISLVGKRAGVAYSDYKEVRKDSTANITVGDWTLVKVVMPVPSNFTATDADDHYLNVGTARAGSGAAYFDDLMCAPEDAVVTGMVYDAVRSLGEAVMNNDGFVSFVEYDAGGRIIYTRKETAEGVKTVTRNRYNYAR